MRYVLLILLALSLINCSSDQSSELDEEHSISDKYFPEFPEKQYQTIALGDSISTVNYLLQSDGYEPKENEPTHLVNSNWNTEIIIQGEYVLNGFKVFIFNLEDIENAIEFKDFFKQQSKSNSESKEFSVYDFQTVDQEFSLSFFEQPDLLRLNFELKSSH